MTGICYVAPDVEVPYHKGSSTHVLELSRALAGLGHDVHVIARRGPLSPEVEEIDGVTFHRVHRGIFAPIRARGESGSSTASEGGKGLSGKAYHLYLETLFAMYVAHVAAGLIEAHGLDVIVERETAFGAGAIASKVCRRPMILEMIGPRYSPLSIGRCSKVLAYGEKMVPKRAMDKSVLISAAVNLDVFKPDTQAGLKVRRRLGFDGAVTVGYVGSFLDWHGVGDFLNAAEIIIGQSRGVRFLMVGPYTRKTGDLVASRGLEQAVHLVGPVAYGTVSDYVNACDVLVAPYNTLGTSRSAHGIGSPLKVLEYMACGKATIGSDLPQVSDLIEHGKTGLLFPQGDSKALATSILKVVADSEYRKQLGERALESVRASYSWSALAGQIDSVIQEVRSRG